MIVTDSNGGTFVKTKIDHNFHLQRNDNVVRWERTRSQDYWHYRKEWNENPKRQVLNRYPIHLDIEATNQCNLKCSMCPRTHMLAKGIFWKIGSVAFDDFKRLVQGGSGKGLRSLKLNYYGEPTLHPQLTDMVRYAKEIGLVDVMFNTNATTLTESLALDILDSGLDQLFFSFDSPYREDFNAIRKGADYDQVLSNIKRFMTVRNEIGRITPFTRVTMVRMKDNQEQCDALRDLFEPIVDAVAFADYLDHEGQNDPERMLVSQNSTNAFCCPQLWQRMFIHPDGECTVCCMDSVRSMRVGNVFKQSVEDIWLGEKYQRIRMLHATGRIDELPTCSRCSLAKY